MSKWRPSFLNCIYVIPDIRGSLDLLKNICARILPLRKSDGGNDTLVFLGNYTGKTEQSAYVFDYLIDIKEKFGDRVVFLRGATEACILRKLGVIAKPFSFECSEDVISAWLRSGGYETVSGYLKRFNVSDVNPHCLTTDRILNLIPEVHINFLINNTINYYHLEDYIFVHAGLDLDKDLEDSSFQSLFFDRNLCTSVIRSIGMGEEVSALSGKTIVAGANYKELVKLGSSSYKPLIREEFMMLDCGSPSRLLVVELRSMDAFLAKKGKKRLIRQTLHESSFKFKN
jgi:serine/threonine protein phosphatase 1